MSSSFVDLSQDHDALRAVLARLSILPAGTPVEIIPLTGGVSSTILKITAAGKSVCLKQALPKLKVAKDWQVPTDRVFGEIDWLETVARFSPKSVPKILGVDRENGCFVMDFLPPEHYTTWKTMLLASQVDVGFAGAVGDALALIHARTAHNPEIAARFATDSNFFAIRLDPYLGETARVHPDLAPHLLYQLERTAHNKITLVQGDISPKNILHGPDGPVFIDAECAWYGDPAFDLAFCCNHMLLKAVHLPEKRAAFIDAFVNLYSRYLAGVTWEEPRAIETRVATLLPGLLLARVDGKSPVEYLNESNRAVVRRASIALLKREATRLADIEKFWKKELLA